MAICYQLMAKVGHHNEYYSMMYDEVALRRPMTYDNHSIPSQLDPVILIIILFYYYLLIIYHF